MVVKMFFAEGEAVEEGDVLVAIFPVRPHRGEGAFPRICGDGTRESACMMAKRIAAFENKEFLKISINSRGFSIKK